MIANCVYVASASEIRFLKEELVTGDDPGALGARMSGAAIGALMGAGAF